MNSTVGIKGYKSKGIFFQTEKKANEKIWSKETRIINSLVLFGSPRLKWKMRQHGDMRQNQEILICTIKSLEAKEKH